MKKNISTKIFLLFILMSCIVFEVQATIAVKIYSCDEGLTSTNMSKPRIYIKNTGTETLSNVTYNYYFQIENSNVPVLEDYYTPYENITLVSDGGSYYHVKYTLTGSLAAGQTLPDVSGNSIGLHYNSWDLFDKTNDYSNNRSSAFAENQKITVYANGTRIYGTEPSSSGDSDSSSSSTTLDNLLSVELQNFAIYSLSGTYVRDRSQYVGGGAIGSNTFVQVNAGASVYGNVVCGGNVALKSSSIVNGNVLANGNVTRDSGSSVTGTITQSAGVSTISIPVLTFTAGTKDSTVTAGSTVTLAPGTYRNLTVQGFATVHMQPGLYTFNNFTLQPDAHVVFDISMIQNLEIRIAGDMAVNDRSTMLFQSTGYAPSVRIYTNDQNTVNISPDTRIAGLVYAPFANVSMYSRAQCNGAIYAKQITVEPDAIVSSSLVDLDGDADHDGDPNYIEVIHLHTDPLDSLSFKDIAIPDPVIVNTNYTDANVVFDVSYFYPEYSKTDSVTLKLPAGSLATGKETILMRISNTAVDFDGNAIAGYSLVTGYREVSRFFSFKQGLFTNDTSVNMTIPVVNVVNTRNNCKIMYYSSSASAWLTVDAEEIYGENGELSVTAALEAPLIAVVIMRTPQATAYLDNGVVFTDNSGLSGAGLSVDITGCGASDTGSISITYIDKTIVSNPVTDTIVVKLRSVQTASGYSLEAEAPDMVIAAGEIDIARIKVTTNRTDINFNNAVNYIIHQGERLMLKASAPTYYFRNGLDPFATLYNSSYELESIDINGEGRAKYSTLDSNELTYDYYVKDHLGSVREVINCDGTVTEALIYQPYGNVVTLKAPSTIDNVRKMFTGKEYDKDGEGSGGTGLALFYFGARYYDPEVGVWTSMDPKDQLFNSYGYSSNPINTVDPNGEWIQSLLIAAEWYLGNATSQGSLNPGEWHWSNPNIWISTITSVLGIGMDLGNDFSNLAMSRNAARNAARGAQDVGSEKPYTDKADWMKKMSPENQQRLTQYSDETCTESLKGTLNEGKPYEARRWIYSDKNGLLQAGAFQKPPAGQDPHNFSMEYEKAPNSSWKRLGPMHGHWDKGLSINLSCCVDGTDIPYFQNVIAPKYDLSNGAIFAASKSYTTGWNPTYGYSYLPK